ncbi:MAG: hypothetical protein HC838_11295 [Spirulinaceae cyanobacterium RM2_2_10]|nr:hypothetical protein [Spirulinaceae cyanobacterium RM2_2_10]
MKKNQQTAVAEELQRLRSQIGDGVGAVVIDPGNYDVKVAKAVIVSAKNSKTGKQEMRLEWERYHFRHGVVTLNDTEYDVECHRLKQQGMRAESLVFQKVYKEDGVRVPINYMIGQRARERAQNKKGASKYIQGYLDALIYGVLLKLYPDGHDCLIVSVGHPAHLWQYASQIVNVVGGRHTLKTHDGREVKFNTVGVTTWDEPNGGSAWFLNGTSQEAFFAPDAMGGNGGKFNFNDLSAALRIGVFDIGGTYTTVQAVEVERDHNRQWMIETTVDSSGDVDYGLNDVMEALKTELRTRHKDAFRSKDIPDHVLQDIIMTGSAVVRGNTFDAGLAREEALYTIKSHLLGLFEDRLQNGLGISLFVLTGGGSAVLHAAFKSGDIIPVDPNVIVLADRNIKDIRYANVSGAALICIQQIEMETLPKLAVALVRAGKSS